MTVIAVRGRINEQGQLEVNLPAGLPAGEVEVQLVFDAQSSQSEPEQWTAKELEELLRVEPLTGAEIVAAGLVGGWENKGITDSSEWVEEQRRKRREERRLTW